MENENTNKRAKLLSELGLGLDATNAEIEAAYIDLCNEWQREANEIPRLRIVANARIDYLTRVYKALLKNDLSEIECEDLPPPEAEPNCTFSDVDIEAYAQQQEMFAQQQASFAQHQSNSAQQQERDAADQLIAALQAMLNESVAQEDQAHNRERLANERYDGVFKLWQEANEELEQMRKAILPIYIIGALILAAVSFDGFQQHVKCEQLIKDYQRLETRYDSEVQRLKSAPALTVGSRPGRSFFASKLPTLGTKLGVPMDAYPEGVNPPY
jgi:hypothetical protein